MNQHPGDQISQVKYVNQTVKNYRKSWLNFPCSQDRGTGCKNFSLEERCSVRSGSELLFSLLFPVRILLTNYSNAMVNNLKDCMHSSFACNMDCSCWFPTGNTLSHAGGKRCECLWMLLRKIRRKSDCRRWPGEEYLNLSWGGNVPVPDRHLRDSLQETEQKRSVLRARETVLSSGR